ncbi:MAG: hypothetical protein NT099_02395, partial [Candidatus Saganbacteria bacterium]|nr:hypothetical protein [Candidatus Saganbacteria bacterium]
IGNIKEQGTAVFTIYNVLGQKVLLEEAKTNGDGKGRIFFKKAQEIYEKFLINLSNPWPYLASQPCMAAVVLEETEVQPLQLLFSYVEVLRAALKQGKDDLDLGPDKEATIAKMLEFYGLLQASFTNPWDKKLVKAAELEFKLGLAAYYKANSRLDLWKKYIGEVLVALEDEPRLLQETPPATEKEATAVLHLRLLRGSALMAQADQLFSVFAETEEVKKLWEEAVKTYSLILKESSGQRLKKMGRTIYDVQIEYLRSSMKLPKFESNPVFMQILKQIEKLEETRKTRELSPEERKFFIQACITIGDAYIWDEKIKDPAKAKLYYDRAESEEKEIKDLAKREVSWLKDALASMYKGQAWTALEISKGTGTAVTLGSAKASQEAEQKFGRLRDLYKDKPNLNPKEIEMLAFAYYGLGELALRGGQAPNYALAIEEYKEALKVLKGNQDPRTGDYKDIDSAKRALAIYNGLADASKGHRKFGDAKTYFESAQKVLEQIKAQISILSEGRAAVEDPKWVKKAEDQIFTGLMRLPKEERALSSYVRATGEVATSSQGDQGVEETAAGGGVAGEVKIPIDDTQTVGVAVAVTGRKLNRSVTSDPKLSNAKAMADIDKQITDLQKEIDALGPTVSRETYLFRMKGLEEDKKQLQEAASKGEKEPLLTSIADMRTSMDIWWEKTFGKVGMLRLDLMGDQNTVWYNTSGRQATQTFLAERLGLKGRFTFTGFQPVAEKWFFQPYAELAGFLGIANKKSGLVEMQTDSAEDNKQWTDGPGAATLAERQKDVSGGALELDYAAALGLQVVRPGIRLGSWGTLDLLGTVEGKYSRDAWGRRAGLFWPGTVTHPSYFVDPTETRKRDLDVTFWTLKMGFDPTLYLCNGNLVISPSISSEFFFREIASRGWSVTARLGIDFYFWEKFPFSVNFNFNTGKQEQSLPWAKDGGEGSQSVFTKWRTYTFDLSWYF